MKKLSFIITFITLSLLWIQPASAHFLATDGNIGAVLHVDPNDDPIAGSQASFFFEFKDKQNKFTPQNCDCTFEIDENGSNIYSQPLFQNSSTPNLNNASVFYTFPQKDVYQVKVVGKPTIPNAFQPFTLTWNFRVDQQAANQTGQQANTNFFFSTNILLIVIIGLVILCALIYFLRNPKKNHKQKRQSKTPSVKKGGNKTYEENNNRIY